MASNNAWTSLDAMHQNLCRVTEHTKRLAKEERLEQSTKQHVQHAQSARAIERDMKELRLRLDRIGQTIHHNMGWSSSASTSASTSTSSSPASSLFSADVGLPSGGMDDEYVSALRKQTEALETALEESNNCVLRAIDNLQILKNKIYDKGAHEAGDDKGGRDRAKGGKKKEQEAKKKERKEKRRREQQLKARDSNGGGLDFDDLAVRMGRPEDGNIAAI